MPGEPRQPYRIGYCTNVHAGATLDAMRHELQTHAVRVREIVDPNDFLDIGLWLSANAADELLRTKGVPAFRDWLAERGLRIFTMNGFPYGDFHGRIVKHRVYEPSWAEPERAQYTLNLARILAGLIDEGDRASISTLPLGWPGPPCKPVHDSYTVSNLEMVALELAELHHRSGRFITVDLEPEPGCILGTSTDCHNFFVDMQSRNDAFHNHIGVCHDICHAAVMFESQREMFAQCYSEGISINKIQVSNAPRALLENCSDVERMEMVAALRAFEEPRYLHQTTVRDGVPQPWDSLNPGKDFAFYEDLPLARADRETLDRLGDEWRIHFHVPIYLEWLGRVGTTRDAIHECLRAMKGRPNQPVLEIETYAWDVLPAEHRGATLAEDIAREILWLREQLAEPKEAAT